MASTWPSESPRAARESRDGVHSTQAAQQAQSQQELNPHFVMDDLAAKTYAIATHLLNYVDHLELEYFKVRDSASVSELQVASTASS